MSAGSLPSGLTRGYAKSFKDMLVKGAAKVLTIKDLNDLDDAEVEAAVNARGRANNPKWDHPVVGYQSFHEDQKEHLRAEARASIARGDEPIESDHAVH